MTRVYVETNFLLELAYGQEQAAACGGILELAERGEIVLALPVLSFIEARKALRERVHGRRSSVNAIRELGRELRRSGRTPEGFDGVLDELARLDELDERGLTDTVDRVRALGAGRLRALSLDKEVVARATVVDQPPWDASILAAVLVDLERAPAEGAVFINRNARDFDKPRVKELLAPLGCALIGSFVDGYSRLTGRPPPGSA